MILFPHAIYRLLSPSDYWWVIVGGVVPGSPAAEAGIETGMTMIRINDTKMQNVAAFKLYGTTRANQTVGSRLLPHENYTGSLTEMAL